MAGNFLADTLASLPAETPADDNTDVSTNDDNVDTSPNDDTAEITEEGADDTAEGDDSEAEGDEGDDEQAEVEAQVDESLLDPEKEYTVGDAKLKGKDITDGVMMRADYTRKTQELADRVKEFEENDRAPLEDYKEAADQWFEAVASDTSGQTMYDELEVNFPEVAKALRQRIIEEELALVDMTEQAAELYRKNAIREASDRVKERRGKVSEAIRAKRERAVKTLELRKTFNGWTEEVMKEVGLDPKDPEQAELVRMAVMKHKGVAWTKDTFLTEAKRIAKIAKIEPPKPATPAKDAKGKFVAAKKGEPPPVAPKGAKRPATEQRGREKPARMDSASYFESLRSR